MVKFHLENDYELFERPMGIVPHFWDTIDVLGGWMGLTLISVGILAFFLVVDYVITTGRKKREAKKK
jgi:hypothetical protein